MNCPVCGVQLTRPNVSEWRDKSAAARRAYSWMVLRRSVVAAIATIVFVVPILFSLVVAAGISVAKVSNVEMESPSALAETWLLRFQLVSVVLVFLVVFGMHALRIGRSQARTKGISTES